MIKKLSRKITTIIMIILMIVLAGILLAVNIFNYSKNEGKVEEILTRISESDIEIESDDSIPEDGLQEGSAKEDNTLEDNIQENNIQEDSTLEDNSKEDNVIKDNKYNREELNSNEKYYRASQYYLIEIDENEELVRILNEGNTGYSDTTLYELAQEALTLGKSKGSIGNFKFHVKDTEDGRLIAFLDNSIAHEQLHSAALYSFIFGLIGSVILFFVSLVLTKWIVKPVSEVFDKQRQFISDASHELKTPLTIINANIDTMEHEYGDSKNFNYIKEETIKMTGLINQLLSLTQVEDTLLNDKSTKFNLSRAVESASLPFDSVAFEGNVNMELEITDNIVLQGDEEQIKQLVAILVDNAIKHTLEEKFVKVNLVEDKGKIILKVMNEGEAIPEEEIKKIFERFYRVDKARNRADGRFGLGLAIAKGIVEKHKGKIHVECKDGWTTFIVRL
ncbi:MAG: ATP-binding protein [Mobilitalea sp.]